MKRITAVILLCFVGYYIGGFYVHFLVKQSFAKNELYANLSASMPSDGEIEFSIPLPLYGNTDRDYEKKEGEFYYKGNYYELLGTKIENNTLVISCMANAKSKVFNEDLFEFIQENIVANLAKKSKNQKSYKLFMPEYALFGKKTTLYIFTWLSPVTKTNGLNYSLTNKWINNNTPPPDQA